ncbi:MAG: prephenate dehydrogenase [Anaerolineales bacterium]|nr:prephenate dehydrogenase [Anaerolineales bacterium]
MSDPAPFSLRGCRVAVVGLGLMGGSLALALREHCAALYGIDPDAETLGLARRWGLATAVSADPAELLPAADLVILAAPVRAILGLLAALPRLHPGTAVVLDVGSTKRAIVAAMERLPARFDPLGGHPMCGKEVSSLAHAYAGMYHGAPFALTPLPRTTARARAAAQAVVQAVGANLLWLDAETHDRWVAATSHLPYLLANALAGATPGAVRPLVGPGFLSTTRVAASAQQVMLDILTTNREPVLDALTQFETRLAAVRAALQAQDWAALAGLLAEGAGRRGELV